MISKEQLLREFPKVAQREMDSQHVTLAVGQHMILIPENRGPQSTSNPTWKLCEGCTRSVASPKKMTVGCSWVLKPQLKLEFFNNCVIRWQMDVA